MIIPFPQFLKRRATVEKQNKSDQSKICPEIKRSILYGSVKAGNESRSYVKVRLSIFLSGNDSVLDFEA